jgi:hypothetical protein
VKGGETPYMQQQNWSLSQLAERPTPEIPAAPPPASPTPTSTPEPDDDGERAAVAFRVKCLELGVS